MPDKPHLIDRGRGLEPASTGEIAAAVQAHAWHNGIAFFSSCAECQKAKERGDYPHWFPKEAK
jgi:hypothetical protein